MKSRLAAFIITLLVLPPTALWLAGQEWQSPAPIAGNIALPALLTILTLLAFVLLLDLLTFRRSSHSLLRSQRSYLLWNGVAGVILGALLAYLNLFVATWSSPAASEFAALLFAALCGGVALPAVLLTRLWLAGLPGAAHLSRRFALPAPPAETAAILLVLCAVSGLLGGVIWTDKLAWLLWPAPLLLLAALQLLWHESTVFSGLAQGNWSRVLLGSASGILVGGIALTSYRASGGALYLDAASWQLACYLAVFGLLCLQLGDVIAENWRGKPRGEVFKKKPFPIPVIVKKD